VANPEILKKGGRWKTMHQPRRHLLHMGKNGWSKKKNSEPIGAGRHPPSLNPPLVWCEIVCWWKALYLVIWLPQNDVQRQWQKHQLAFKAPSLSNNNIQQFNLLTTFYVALDGQMPQFHVTQCTLYTQSVPRLITSYVDGNGTPRPGVTPPGCHDNERCPATKIQNQLFVTGSER